MSYISSPDDGKDVTLQLWPVHIEMIKSHAARCGIGFNQAIRDAIIFTDNCAKEQNWEKFVGEFHQENVEGHIMRKIQKRLENERS